MRLVAWLASLAARRAAAALPLPQRAGVADDAPVDEGVPRGCGWFDSSHELRAGLAVIEHEVVDATPATWLPAFCAPGG